MSSPVFEAKLQPDPSVRRAVLLSGVFAMLAGVVLIMLLNTSISWRLAGTAVWIMDCLWQIWAFRRGASRVVGIHVDSTGQINVVDAGGRRRAVRLLTGSMVLPKIAWLRIRLPDGRRYAELLVAARVEAGTWHAFQLIWQQCREAFGHTVRA